LLLNRPITQGLSVSPDGKWLSYALLDENHPDSPRSIRIADTQSGEEIEVVSSTAFAETFWLLDSQLLIIEYPDWRIASDSAVLLKGAARHVIFEPLTGRKVSASWYVTPPANGTVLYSPTFDCAAEKIFDHQSLDTLRVICMGNDKPITVATPLSLGDVAWSFDGELLAFSTEETTTSHSRQISVWQRETDTIRVIDVKGQRVLALSWSPDRQWLAYEDGSDLCILSLVAEDLTCYEDYLSGVGRPVSWSPDSRSIILTTRDLEICAQIGYDCSSPVLVMVEIPDGTLRKLATNVSISPEPRWGR
jgi:WD40 repeat protein